MRNILTVDVEDWFHLLELETAPDIDQWGQLESRVERSFLRLLDVFDETKTKVTCFFLGWIAQRFPNLVIEASKRGHEIASHGFGHQLVYRQTRAEFADDVRRSKDVLEDIINIRVKGFRAPGFSITPETPWAFEEIVLAGFEYDSSVFPARRGHGGMSSSEMAPYKIQTSIGSLLEMPVSVVPVLGHRICVFGGGYLRLAPYVLIEYLTDVVNRSGRPVIYYVHPREIDPDHPRIPMGFVRKFKSYVNLRSTLPKLRALSRRQNLVSINDWREDHDRVSGLARRRGLAR